MFGSNDNIGEYVHIKIKHVAFNYYFAIFVNTLIELFPSGNRLRRECCREKKENTDLIGVS